MLFRSPAHPGRAVRLGYCMNLHAAETLDELIAGMQRITLPLRERLAPGAEFGVGMYLPAQLARELANDPAQLAQLKRFLDEHALDPFTYNAFPYGGFQTDGLKERVFEPTWGEQTRIDFTLDVASVSTQLARRDGGSSYISISTHCGAHSSHFSDSTDRNRKLDIYAANFARVAKALAALESAQGRRVVLSLEPEPRSSCNDVTDLDSSWRRMARHSAPTERHLAMCFDACHSAVEYEGILETLIAREVVGVGKFQFSSALALQRPAENRVAREQFLAMDEPRFLHQVTAAGEHGLTRAGDLPEVRRALWLGEARWRDAEEWRCHFHVPVDRERIGDAGLTTTRAHANRELDLMLKLDSWRLPELHVEIETYTWDVLPRAARGAGELVDGLEREYRHVIGVLESAGWKHCLS